MDSNWKEYRKQGAIHKEARLKRHQKFIYTFAYKNNLRHTPISPYQIRISNDETTLDIFPKSKRYHNLTLDKRGSYHYLKGFLKSIYGTRESIRKDHR